MDICHRNLKLINCLKILMLLRLTKVKVIFFYSFDSYRSLSLEIVN